MPGQRVAYYDFTILYLAHKLHLFIAHKWVTVPAAMLQLHTETSPVFLVRSQLVCDDGLRSLWNSVLLNRTISFELGS